MYLTANQNVLLERNSFNLYISSCSSSSRCTHKTSAALNSREHEKNSFFLNIKCASIQPQWLYKKKPKQSP